jgi:hypothetical protein
MVVKNIEKKKTKTQLPIEIGRKIRASVNKPTSRIKTASPSPIQKGKAPRMVIEGMSVPTFFMMTLWRAGTRAFELCVKQNISRPFGRPSLVNADIGATNSRPHLETSPTRSDPRQYKT